MTPLVTTLFALSLGGLAATYLLYPGIVLLLAPLSKYVLPVSVLAMVAYVSLLSIVLAGGAHQKEAIG